MKVTLRQSVLSLLVAQLLGNIVFTAFGITQSPTLDVVLIGAVSTIISTALLFAYWRGWDYARHVTQVLITLLVAFGVTEAQSALTLEVALLPSAFALVLLGPEWIVGSAVTVVVVRLLRTPGQSVLADPAILLVYAGIVIAMVLAKLVMDTTQRMVEANTRRAEEALTQASEQAQQLTEANQQQEAQLDEQRRLIDLVATLEVPAVTLADGVLFAPVVGHLDSRRAQALTMRLLEQTYAQRARLVILDIAGVAAVDTLVATALLHTAQALQLLGCHVTISGISAEVAATLTQQGVELNGVRTVRSPQAALAQHAGRALVGST